MKMDDFENRIRKHAENVKISVASPFNIEGEDLSMENKSFNMKKMMLVIAAATCLLGTTAFAAYRFWSAKQIANELGDTTLAEYFDENEIISETKIDGKYKATVLGIANGEKISKFKSSAWEVYPDRTYVAVAVERTDGTTMTYDDEILVTPLIEGLAPWKYNIVTMHGGYSAQVIDGILYRIIECDSVEFFADRNLYLAIVDKMFLDNKPYTFEESTGHISVNDQYEGTNILFDLELDKSKADSEKAKDYIKSLEVSEEEEDSSTDIKEFRITDEEGEIRLEEVK